MVETIAAKLTQLQSPKRASLFVIPLSEVRKEKITSAREARQFFGATLVLNGKIQRNGNLIRVIVNLVDATNLLQLRSAIIDTRFESIYELQDKIALLTGEWLGLKVSPEARKNIAAGRTTVPAAYELYLQGLGELARSDRSENLDSATTHFLQASSKDPQFALAFAGLGETFWRRYKLLKIPSYVTNAQSMCEQALSLETNLVPALVTLGKIHSTMGQHKLAFEELRRALAQEPGNGTALLELAGAYRRSNMNKEAEQTFQSAIDRNPTYSGGYNEFGVYYFNHGNYAKAGDCFRKVIELTPDNYIGHRNLGGIYLAQDRFDDAKKALQKSIDIRPTPIAYSNLGTAYFFETNYAAAVDMYEKAVKDDDRDAVLWGNLGDAQRYTGKTNEARHSYDEAIRIAGRNLTVTPGDAELRGSLAMYYALVGETGKAWQEVELAFKNDPANVNVIFQKALVYELTGDRDQALKELESALRSGYSLSEVQRHPDLGQLRSDTRFNTLLAGLTTKTIK